MQSLLASLADIDFEHDRELERCNNSSLDPSAKRQIGEALNAAHQQRRELYVRSLMQLQQSALNPRQFPARDLREDYRRGFEAARDR